MNLEQASRTSEDVLDVDRPHLAFGLGGTAYARKVSDVVSESRSRSTFHVLSSVTFLVGVTVLYCYFPEEFTAKDG